MSLFDLEAGPSETESEDDDLDAPRKKEAPPKKPNGIGKSMLLNPKAREATPVLSDAASSISNEASDLEVYGDGERLRKRLRANIKAPEKIIWSDDDSANDGETAWKTFKARKTVARSKAIKSSLKARAIEAEVNPQAVDRPGLSKIKKRGRGKTEETREYGDDSDEDNDLMEWTIPEYLKERRSEFEKRLEKLKEGGLKLPPSYDVYFSDDDRLEHLKERPDFPNAKPVARYRDIRLPYSLGLIPAPIAQWLREYQVTGTSFLHELFVYQKGGILGDDMGLGKTVQVIVFMTAAYGKTGDERDQKRLRKMRRGRDGENWYPRTLIICPGSLMANWQDELRRWGWWHSDIYHGSTSSKEAVLSSAQAGMLEVMITTYTTYRLNKGAINMIKWDCVVADECHTFKERKSEIAGAMNEVNALCRIGLTGTAIQNKYEELWTLLNWTNPGRFGPISTWKASICEPLKLGQSHDATVYQLARARKTAKSLVENLLPQFFLRRMKTLIKDQLPKKSDRVVFCPLTETQTDAYQRYLDSEIVQAINSASDLCYCGSKKKKGWCHGMELSDGSKWQAHVFPAISTLQKISNHLANLIPQGNDPSDKQAKDLDTLQLCLPDQWEELYATRDNMLNYANPKFCGKWHVLRKLLQFWHDEGGNKILVFSHSVRLLKMLQTLFLGVSYNVSYLDGSMSYDDRFAVVREFNTDPTQFVFLISTKAGGVGLNITSANKVVVVDPNWNPSYDLQAQDRAYRIGQTRDVEVFRLVSQGTIEEIIYARQIYKQQQASIGYNASSERRYFQGVQGRGDKKGEIFGLTNLFKYQDNGAVVLRDIVNKTNVAESKADVRVIGMDIKDGDNDAKPEDADDFGQQHKSEPVGEEEAMSQIVAMITGEEDKRRAKRAKSAVLDADNVKRPDPISAILQSVGVEYTHENSEVIGSSKVEARLSKRAEEAAEEKGENWATQAQQARVFLEDSQEKAEFDELTDLDVNGGIKYRYRPPEAVKKRQLCTMAEWAGYDDVVAFACAVEAWTQEERRDFLSQFYRSRAIMLSGSVKNGDTGHLERTITRAKDFTGYVYGDENPLVKVYAHGDSSGTVKAEVKTDSSDDEL
jgi:SNF2 family DNA or RNA helicase